MKDCFFHKKLKQTTMTMTNKGSRDDVLTSKKQTFISFLEIGFHIMVLCYFQNICVQKRGEKGK